MAAGTPPTQSIWATVLPARSAEFAMVSACRTPAPENDERLLNVSPVRKKVLFVEPVSLGHVPVAMEYQPTPVLGGKACSMPFAPCTPSASIWAYAGIEPWFTYFCMRSGRIPSDEKNRALSAGATGTLAVTVAFAVPNRACAATTEIATSAPNIPMNRRRIMGPPPPLLGTRRIPEPPRPRRVDAISGAVPGSRSKSPELGIRWGSLVWARRDRPPGWASAGGG